MNNQVDNLEWCTSLYNNNYGTRNARIKEKLMNHPNYYIPVLCYDINNNFIKRYESAEQAGQELGISGSGITACCREGYKRISAGGYKWKYEKNEKDISEIEYIPQKKIVHQFDLTGNFIKTYESQSEAAKQLNKDIHNFNTAIKKGIAYNYFWIIGDDFSNVDKLLSEIAEKQHHIYQIDEQGNIVNKFKSGLEAESITGIYHSNISHAMLSKTKEGKLFRKSGGFYWVDINLDPNYIIDFNFKKRHGEKGIIQCDLNGQELRKFNSIADAQEFLGMSRTKISSIYDCFKPNKNKKTAYGFIWKKQ